MERSLTDILARLPIPGLKESTHRHIVAETISSELSVPIKPSTISIKDQVLRISVPPVVKSAIYIKQTVLIDLLAKKGVVIQKIN